jgi:hypothetical protein
VTCARIIALLPLVYFLIFFVIETRKRKIINKLKYSNKVFVLCGEKFVRLLHNMTVDGRETITDTNTTPN